MAEITLSAPRTGGISFGYIITAADGRDVLVQTDYDYPGVATSFGWSIAATDGTPDGLHGTDPDDCTHDGTDGTITCEACGLTASEFIAAATDYLDANLAATADDPGYFME